MGLELQLEELQEQRQRAEVQGRFEDVRELEPQIEQLQYELAITADLLDRDSDKVEPPQLHDAEKLSVTDH